MINSEQWKSGGNCEICRRKSYCKKICGASNKAMQRAIDRAVISSSSKIMGAYAYMAANTISDYFEREDNKNNEV